MRLIDVGALVREKQLHDGWDDEYQTYILDEDRVSTNTCMSTLTTRPLRSCRKHCDRPMRLPQLLDELEDLLGRFPRTAITRRCAVRGGFSLISSLFLYTLFPSFPSHPTSIYYSFPFFFECLVG